MAATSAGVVLSVGTRHHALQLVDRHHVVHAYRFRGQLPGVGLGSRVRIKHSGTAIKHLVSKRARARTVSFLGQVVRIGSDGVVLRLGDRKLMRFPATLIHSRSSKRPALATGMVVLINETVGGQKVQHVTLKPSSATSAGGTPGAGGTPEASGTVVELDPDALAIQSANGSTLRFAVAASVITNLQLSLCDTVNVSYHRSGPTLVGDSVKSTDASAISQCANDGTGGGSGAPGQDVVGTIAQLTLSSATISTASGASLRVAATPDISGGFMIADQVDVTYTQSSDGTLVASDIEYQDQDAIGTVTSVENGSITLVDSTTSQSETFTDDPANGTFDGIAPGDQVDVSYHVTSAGTAVDSVSDLTNPN